MGILAWLTPGGAIASFVSKVFTGPAIQGLVDGYKAKLSADNTTDKILADVAGREIALRQRQAELDSKAMQMEQGRWWTAAPRAVVQWSLAIFIAKVVVYDKVFGLGTTDPIKDPMIVDAFGKIILMWFGGRTLEKMTQTIVNRIK